MTPNEHEQFNWLLDQYGITGQYAKKIYSVILEEGQCTANCISNKTGIPSSKVYEILETFQHRNLVRKIFSRPAKFVVNSPSIAFSDVIGQTRKKCDSAERILAQATTFANQPTNRDSSIHLIEGRETLFHTIQETLEKETIKTYDAVIGFSNPSNILTHVIRKKIRQGLRVRFIGNITKENLTIALTYKKMGVKVKNYPINVPTIRFSILNNDFLAFTLADSTEFTTIWTESEPLITSMNELFDHYWNAGKNI